MAKLVHKGGKGSGNWGHAGRPGKVGGSAPQGGAFAGLGDNRDNIGMGTQMLKDDGGAAHDYFLAAEKDMIERHEGQDLWQPLPSVVDYIAHDTDIPRDVVYAVLNSWGDSSSDDNGWFIQVRAAKLFGERFGTGLSKWQKKIFAHKPSTSDANGIDELSDIFAARQRMVPDDAPESPAEVVDKILVSMYNRTQRDLAARGVDGFKLYRGVHLPGGEFLKKSDYVAMDENPLESWSQDYLVAVSFADLQSGDTGVVLQTYIPRERILSTAHTGFGVHTEREVTIVGANINFGGDEPYGDYAVVRYKTKN